MKKTNQLSLLPLLPVGPTQPTAVPYHAHESPRTFVPHGFAIETGIFKKPSDVTSDDFDMMRKRLTGLKSEDEDCPLEMFIQDVLRNDLLVSAYFHPKHFEGLPTSIHPNIVPVTMATRAARKAQCLQDVGPLEGRFTYIAALLHSSGLFYCSMNQELMGQPVLPMGCEDFRIARSFLLDPAIKKFRRRHKSMGNTMAAVMGMPTRYSCELHQFARITTAICLSNLRQKVVWATVRF